MKRKILRTTIQSILIVLVSFACKMKNQKNNVDYVNPFIGTGDSDVPSVWESNGGTYPGAALPFGMVQSTPDAYKYDISEIGSFSLINHTSGYPKGSSGDFQIMPFSGEYIDFNHLRSSFKHESEEANPGYYSVLLQKDSIKVETTVTPRNALLRFSYYKAGNRGIALFGMDTILAKNNRTIQGICRGIYFVLSVNKEYNVLASHRNHIIIELSDKWEIESMVKVGFSYNSFNNAIENQKSELKHWDFELVRKEARKEWIEIMNLIELEGGSDIDREIFYTALYHSFLDPHLISDVGDPVRYSGLSPWDTYHTKQPLITLMAPEAQKNMISSVLDVYDEAGIMDPGPMTGDHNVPILVDSYRKGIEMDAVKAYKAMESSLVHPPYSRKDFGAFTMNGFVPAGYGYSVTKTLEYAYDYWAMHEMAKELNIKKDTDRLNRYSLAYNEIYNPSTNFMTARSLDGDWQKGGYREGDKWAYNWSVVHDVRGLINLSGGNEHFISQLEESFSKNHYYHDNEPPIHNAYLFNYAGRPWLTQKWVHNLAKKNYSNSPGGLPGNDDLGALSAWYVFSTMGFYPVCPGRPEYVFGVPLFDKITLNLSNGQKFTVEAKNLSEENCYIQTKTLNGASYPAEYISHTDIVNGGHLQFEMGPEPVTNEITDASLLPKSLTKTRPEITVDSWDIDKDSIDADEQFTIAAVVKNNSAATGTYKIHVRVDDENVKSEGVLLKPGQTKTKILEIRLYKPGNRTISINHDESKGIFVKSGTPSTFTYADIEIPHPPIISVDSICTFSTKIKNVGNYTGNEEVAFSIDGKLIEQKQIEIGPGQTERVEFEVKFDESAFPKIQIGKKTAKKILVYGKKANSSTNINHLASQVVGLDFNEERKSSNQDVYEVHGDVQFVQGIFGRAIQTDATDNAFVEILPKAGHKAINSGKVCTMMLWVYPMDEKNFSDILSRGDINVIQVRASNTEVNYYSGGWQRGEAYSLLPDDWNKKWHHIAGVSDKKELKLYIDGNLVSQKRVEKFDHPEIMNDKIPWNIGRNAQNTDRSFNGLIDEVKIFDKALTSEEVKEQMLNVSLN